MWLTFSVQNVKKLPPPPPRWPGTGRRSMIVPLLQRSVKHFPELAGPGITLPDIFSFFLTFSFLFFFSSFFFLFFFSFFFSFIFFFCAHLVPSCSNQFEAQRRNRCCSFG